MQNVREYDVIVAGGGPAGTAAAVSSARMGAQTLLVEKYGFLGGMGTAGLVAPFMQYGTGRLRYPYRESNIGKQLVAGIFQEVIDRLTDDGCFGGTGYPYSFDPEGLKYVLNELVISSGVELLLHTFITDAVSKDGEIKELAAFNKSGPCMLKAQIYIDCTGDGDIAFRSGAHYQKGRSEDGLCQPATLMFTMGGVDIEAGYVEHPVPEEAGLPQGRVLFFKMPRQGEVVVNMTRIINFDAADADQLTRGEIEARRQVKQIVNYLKKFEKGFENSYLIQTAPQLGVRESRRILGEYLLTADDLMQCRKFDDAVAKSAYPIDIHNPMGKGFTSVDIPEGEWYEIPYRCLMPKGVTNLLTAGRCISSTHEAHAAIRVQPTCYATGQGAGTAAAIAVKNNVSPKDVDTALLMKALREQNAVA